jgi:REP element-mobilizing transposase RayT
MARPLRVNVADGWYHVMHRGIERRAIFTERRDYEHFLSLLAELSERYRFRIHAYCLLGNHYHAIVQTPDANLSRGMQWFGLAYSAWFNARHHRVGTLFQGRFRSVPVEEGAWVYELSTYIHLNPVRTVEFGLDKKRNRAEARGLGRAPTPEQISARLKRLREYPWSSYRAYSGYTGTPSWLTTAEILKRASRRVDERQQRYRTHVQQQVRRGVEEDRIDQFRDVLAIGSAGFVEGIRKLAGGGQRETERRGRLRRSVDFEDVVAAVEEARGEDRGEWLHRHGDRGKWMVLWLARRYCGLTHRELGARMGGMDYAAVCVGLGRFEKRMARDGALREERSRAVQMLDV